MGYAINRKICHFYYITSGPGKKIKSNSGLFECQFYEIEVNANTVGNGPASIYTYIVFLVFYFCDTHLESSLINDFIVPFIG